FPPGLRQGSADLGRLRQPAQVAQQQLELALEKLKTMSVGKTDPNYDDVYRAVATSDGAVSGKNPQDGSEVAPGYHGMDASLATAQSQLAGAAGDADRIVSGFRRLNRALAKLYGGSSRLRAGIARLRAGAARLDAGLQKLNDGSGRLTGGIGGLSDGSGRLVSGINRLANGSSQLSSGLDRGSAGTTQLAGGLSSMHGRVSTFASKLPATTGGLSQLTTQAPGLFDSSYF